VDFVTVTGFRGFRGFREFRFLGRPGKCVWLQMHVSVPIRRNPNPNPKLNPNPNFGESGIHPNVYSTQTR